MGQFWTGTSQVVAQALLDHHRSVCGALRPDAPITDGLIRRCTLTYDELRRKAKIGGIAQDMGRHLRKVATWCEMRGFPPLHALVVRADAGDPGEGYQRCAATSGDWNTDIRQCIAFRGYPQVLR